MVCKSHAQMLLSVFADAMPMIIDQTEKRLGQTQPYSLLLCEGVDKTLSTAISDFA